MKIDPWSSTTYQDYSRLRDEFGIQEQLQGTSRDEAVELFNAAAPTVGELDIKVKVYWIPYVGTVVIIR